MTAREPRVLASDLMFPEGPRWHEGRLWFSDQVMNRVFALDESGACELIANVPQGPSGLGWDRAGRLLIVSMLDRKLLRHDAASGALEVVADLWPHADFHCNDMVVDARGRAYIGNFGFDLWAKAPEKPTVLLLVDEAGAVRVVADDLLFPNGMAITPDGNTLIVAETHGKRLTAFEISADGSLSNRRLWAEVGQHVDGITLDAEGCVWAAIAARPGAFLRVAEGGAIRERIDVPDSGTYACMLGGAQGRTLFMLEARHGSPKRLERGNGRVRCVEVEVPRAGLP